ncbi:MAG: PH domain-containing protein [Crocinitomicaceae bacterium]
MLEEEKKIFEISMSHWVNTSWYSIGGSGIVLFLYTTIKCYSNNWDFFFYLSLLALFFCIGFTFYHFLLLKTTKFKITSQRIEKTDGIFSRTTTNLELYRVKDLQMKRNLIQRMVGIGSVELTTSDQSDHRFHLNGIQNYEKVFTTIRHHVETNRIARGVREVDQNDHFVTDH